MSFTLLKWSALGAMVLTSACGQHGWPLASVTELDLERYAGRWYEIASYPQIFQLGCSRSQARYAVENNGTVGVTNTCVRNGRVSTVRGTAVVPDPSEPGHLVVDLRVPVVGKTRSDYYIMALNPGYQWSLVGHPTRNYLWILSRTPELPADTINQLAETAERDFEYADVRSRLHCTQQDGADIQTCLRGVAGN